MPTLLAAAHAEPISGLPGRSLVPLLRDKPTVWRRYLFTEFHTHATGTNFYPQRTFAGLIAHDTLERADWFQSGVRQPESEPGDE